MYIIKDIVWKCIYYNAVMLSGKAKNIKITYLQYTYIQINRKCNIFILYYIILIMRGNNEAIYGLPSIY